MKICEQKAGWPPRGLHFSWAGRYDACVVEQCFATEGGEIEMAARRRGQPRIPKSSARFQSARRRTAATKAANNKSADQLARDEQERMKRFGRKG